jgi:UDP-N-acetylmuramoylalanine--D-glutamate ligase
MSWLVFGGGLSGIAAAELLISRGETVVLFDQKPLDPVSKERLKQQNVNIVIGSDISGLHLETIKNCVLSPGISASDPLVARLRLQKTEIISEIDLALQGFPGQVVGVTGTNGKSTTVSMIHHVLTSGGIESSLAGNIGIPPSALVREQTLKDLVILELSSYQLEQSHKIPCSFAAITSFTPDHLGRHGDLDSYFMAKWKILDGASPNCLIMLCPAAREKFFELELSSRGLVIDLITEEECVRYGVSKESTGITLKHNLLNGLVAVRAGMHIGQMSQADCLHALKSFQGLEHRFEYVGSISKRQIFNDSKATNVASTVVALESLESPAILFLGGQSKGESFEPILDFRDKISGIIAFGASRQEIVRDIKSEVPLLSFATLKDALANFHQILNFQPGSIVFSPACSSFDEFRNFEDRGQFFKRSILQLL